MEPRDLNQLTQRVREGDLQARAQLKHRLEPEMAHIVRRVLEKGEASTSLERKILAAARRLAPDPDAKVDERRSTPLARNLCQMIVSRLWPGGTEGALHATMVS